MSQENPMKRGFGLLLTALGFSALLAASLMGLWMMWDDSQVGRSVAALEQLIQAEVPPDCDPQQAGAWFERHGIDHDFFPDTTGDRAGSRTMPMLAGLRDEDLGGMARGCIDGLDAHLGFGRSGRITVYFFFDKQGRRAGHLVHPFVYSL